MDCWTINYCAFNYHHVCGLNGKFFKFLKAISYNQIIFCDKSNLGIRNKILKSWSWYHTILVLQYWTYVALICLGLAKVDLVLVTICHVLGFVLRSCKTKMILDYTSYILVLKDKIFAKSGSVC